MVIGGLFLLSFLPETSFLRPVSLVDEVFGPEKTTGYRFQNDDIANALDEELASISAMEEVGGQISATQRYDDVEQLNSNQIIDYGASTTTDISSFFRKLTNEKTIAKQPVRIAVMGDSYFAADAFSALLRDRLQTQYGGSGVGYISMIPTNKKGYRPPVFHLANGWTKHRMDTPSDKEQIGLDGHYFKAQPRANAYVYGLKNYSSRLAWGDRFSLYVANQLPVSIALTTNEEDRQIYSIPPADGLNHLQINTHVESVRLEVLQGDEATFYAMAIDSKGGVCIDDLSVDEATGLHLNDISTEMLANFNRVRPYDLVILQYGSLLSKRISLEEYKQTMGEALRKLKHTMPHTTFLLISAGSQAIHWQDKVASVSMEQVVECQRQIAKENQIAYWNLYYTMGGEDGLKKLVQAGQASVSPNEMGRIGSTGSINIALQFLKSLNEAQLRYGK